MKKKLNQKTSVFNDQIPSCAISAKMGLRRAIYIEDVIKQMAEEKPYVQLENTNFNHFISASSGAGKSVFTFHLLKEMNREHGFYSPFQVNNQSKG